MTQAKLNLSNESFIFYHGITWRFKEPVPAPEVLSMIPEEADTLRLLIESEHESLFYLSIIVIQGSKIFGLEFYYNLFSNLPSDLSCDFCKSVFNVLITSTLFVESLLVILPPKIEMKMKNRENAMNCFN